MTSQRALRFSLDMQGLSGKSDVLEQMKRSTLIADIKDKQLYLEKGHKQMNPGLFP